jgi:hypothetical protein
MLSSQEKASHTGKTSSHVEHVGVRALHDLDIAFVGTWLERAYM